MGHASPSPPQLQPRHFPRPCSLLVSRRDHACHPNVPTNDTMRLIHRQLDGLKRDYRPSFFTAHPTFRCSPHDSKASKLLFRRDDQDWKIYPGEAPTEEWSPIYCDYGRWLWCVRFDPRYLQTTHTTFPSTLSIGRGTGGVSLIQTVGDSSDANCLTVDDSSMSSFFTLNPPTPSQCAAQTVSWNSTRYRQPPDIRGFIPGGRSFTLDRPTSNNTTQRDWDVHIREGTQIVFLVLPVASNQNMSRNTDARTSPLITVTGKSSQDDACLGTNSPSSTVVSAPIAYVSAPIASTTVPAATDPSGKVK